MINEDGRHVIVSEDVVRESMRSGDAVKRVDDHDPNSAIEVSTSLQMRHFEWLVTKAALEGIEIPRYVERMIRQAYQVDPDRHRGVTLNPQQMAEAKAAIGL